MRTRGLRTWRSITLVVLGVVSWPAADRLVHAQFGARAIPGDQAGQFIAPPRSIEQQLQEAEQAIQQDQMSEAVLRLGALLQREGAAIDSDVAGQDFFLEPEQPLRGKQVLRESLLQRASDVLGQLPPKGLDLYELNYGAAARKDLEQATVAGDWDALQEVSRRYFHTRAGYQATYLWAYRQLNGGRPLAAVVLLQRLARQPRARQLLGGQLDVALARATQLADRPMTEVVDALHGVAGQAAGGVQAQRYRIGDVDVVAPADGEESNWLQDHFAALQRRSAEPQSDYPLAGGNPARSGNGGGQMPLTSPRWKLPTVSGALQERSLRTTIADLSARSQLPAPTWMPLLVGDQLLMRTTERLVAVDFATGKRVWEYPWFSSSSAYEQSGPDITATPDEEGTLLRQRIWNDLPYGRITSDGRRVFLLHKLGELETAALSPFGRMPFQTAKSAESSGNTLVALDLPTEGKILWTIGVDGSEPHPLSEAFFLGPPLPLHGRLYVIAELAGDIVLLCLDPATGDERWRQQLLAIESGGIQSDPIRRVAGAMPAYKDGVLICPTGAGAVVAFDLTSRSLLWGASYPRNDVLSSSVTSAGRGLEPDQLMQRWLDGTPMIVGSTVLVTPIESERLFAFDLLTGRQLWTEIPRGSMRYLAGVRDGKIILAGTRHLQAIDLRSGRPVWEWQMQDAASDEQIAGIGAFGGDLYYVPTTQSRIVAVDVTTGQTEEVQRTDYSLGNMVAADGQLIVQGPLEIAVAYGQRSLAPQVEQALRKSPDDRWATVRQAELLIEQGQRDEALRWLEKARRLAPDDEEIRALSVSAMLGSLKSDFAANQQLLEPLQRLIQRPEKRVELLTLMIQGSIDQQQLREAAQRLIELSTLVAAEPTLRDGLPSLARSGDAENAATLDSWIAGRAAEIADQLQDDQRAEVDARVAAHLADFAGSSSGLLQRLVDHFGRFAGADDAREQLIRRYLGEAAIVRAERLALEAYRQDSGDQRRARFGGLLALVYRKGGFEADASAVVEDVSLDRLSEDLRQELATAAATSPAPPVWPPHVNATWNAPENIRLGGRTMLRSARQSVVETTFRRGVTMRPWTASADDGTPLSLRDPQGHAHAVQMAGYIGRNDGFRQVMFDGGLLVALMPGEIVAVDLFQLHSNDPDAVLWQRPWRSEAGGRMTTPQSRSNPFGDTLFTYIINDGAPQDAGGQLRVGPIVDQTLFVLSAGDLQAVDVLSSELRWRTPDAPRSGYLVADQRRVAVASPDAQRIDVYSTADGHKLDSRPWPEKEAVWYASGPHLLTYERSEANRPTLLRLRNLLTDEVLLEHAFQDADAAPPQQVKGQIVDGRLMAVLDSRGQVVVWDLIEGRVLAEPVIDSIDQLSGLRVVRRDEDLILLPERSVAQERKENRLPAQVSWGQSHFRVDGPVVAVSLRDGDVQWQRTLPGGPWGFTVGQAPGSPLLAFSRAFPASQPGRGTQMLGLLALDARDGSVLHQREDLALEASVDQMETELTIDPEAGQVRVELGPYSMLYEFTDEAPKADPAAEDAEDADAAASKPEPVADASDESAPPQPAPPDPAEEAFQLFQPPQP